MELNFEVQTKSGLRSDILASVKAPNEYSCFVLNHNYNWSGYELHLVLIEDTFADVNNWDRIVLKTIIDTPAVEEWIKEQCGT